MRSKSSKFFFPCSTIDFGHLKKTQFSKIIDLVWKDFKNKLRKFDARMHLKF